MKRLVRYLQAMKNMEHHIYLADIPAYLDTYVDANFANDLDTRRSTSSGMIWFGTVRICSWARTQKGIALSTAEAEFNAIVAGICEAIFVANLLREFLDKEIKNRVFTDSSAAKAMTMRKGGGRVKHLNAKSLFVHDLVEQRECARQIFSRAQT